MWTAYRSIANGNGNTNKTTTSCNVDFKYTVSKNELRQRTANRKISNGKYFVCKNLTYRLQCRSKWHITHRFRAASRSIEFYFASDFLAWMNSMNRHKHTQRTYSISKSESAGMFGRYLGTDMFRWCSHRSWSSHQHIRAHRRRCHHSILDYYIFFCLNSVGILWNWNPYKASSAYVVVVAMLSHIDRFVYTALRPPTVWVCARNFSK